MLFLGSCLKPSLEDMALSYLGWIHKQDLVLRKSFQVTSLTDGGPETAGVLDPFLLQTAKITFLLVTLPPD